MSNYVYVFAGKSQSRSPFHCATSSRQPQEGLRYKSLCGVWITADVMTFSLSNSNSCSKCCKLRFRQMRNECE